jgi:hypothetical protein
MEESKIGNPTVKAEKKSYRVDFLTDKEKEHDEWWKNRMEAARDERDKARDEFDGLGYLDAYDRDNKAMLAYIAPAKNDGESELSTGTTRQAALSLISRAIAYNYETEFTAFDKENRELTAVSRGLEVAVKHANYLDDVIDKIKEMANEMFGHGDAFWYSDWVVKYRIEKSHPKFNGDVKGVTWSERKKVYFEGIESRIAPGRRIYVGDIYTSGLKNQPFCYEVNHIPYEVAKMKYGDWERWQYVPDDNVNRMDDSSSYMEDFRIEDGPEGTIEEKLCVDLPNNEMQIYINGVPMLPAGFPMKWEHEEYPWAHQGLEPVRAGFFYSRSFVRTLQNMQDIENDIWRVIIMLAWKAAQPPMANATGQVITRQDIQAGKIIDLDPDYFKPIFDGSLANTGFIREVANEIRNNMVSRSVPETKQGTPMSGDPTATYVTQLNKEAEIAISMSLSAIAGIVSKCDWLKAGLLLQHAMKKGYRSMSPTEGGVVSYIVEVVEELNSSRELMQMEGELEKQTGRKHKIFQLKDGVRSIINRIEGRAVPKPRASSALDKAEIQNLAQTMMAIFGPDIDKSYLEEQLRRAFRIPNDVKLLNTNPMPAVQQGSPPKPVQPLPNQMVSNDMPM